MLKEFKEEDYYIPSLEELMLEILTNGKVYGILVDEDLQICSLGELVFTDNLVNDLVNFSKGNDFDTGKGYSVNTSLYRIKKLTSKDIYDRGFSYSSELPHVDMTEYVFSRGIHNFEKLHISVYKDNTDSTSNAGLKNFLPNIEIRKKTPVLEKYMIHSGEWDENVIFQGNVRSIGELNLILKLLGY